MAIASIQDTLFAFSRQKADLTSRLTTIMSRLTVASSQNLEIMQEATASREALNKKVQEDPSYAETVEYQTELEAIDNDFELQMAEINSWESALDQEKSALETRVKQIEIGEQNYSSMLKGNIKKDFTYAGGGGH